MHDPLSLQNLHPRFKSGRRLQNSEIRSFALRSTKWTLRKPVARQADSHPLLKLMIGCGFFSPPRPSATIRQNTHGMMWRACLSRSRSASAGPRDRASLRNVAPRCRVRRPASD
jgi:hypothetical protein